jgi:FkbM family methyltransferase
MNLLDIPVLRRLIPSLVRRCLIFIKKYKININLNNFIFEIDIRESIERKTYFIREYEKKRMSYLLQTSKRIQSEILIDIGANIGFYSILLSEYFNIIKSYEPNIRNFQALTKNIEKNNLQKKIQTFNYGLGNKKQILKGNSMTKGELFQTSGFSLSEKNIEGEEVFINIGDDVLDFKEQILTIKIDVEGFELFVVQGIKRLLENNNCILQIEIWDKNYEATNNFLNNLGYKKCASIDGDTYFSNKILN